MERLECSVQNYAWGAIGTASFVGRLLEAAGKVVDEKKPYAELWMGTHPNGPSRILTEEGDSSVSLLAYLQNRPKNGNEREKDGLLFLFKILSVAKALSIQVHPTKEQAKELHESNPKEYPDANHKPEMAIALTPFEMLCGFRPSQEIVANLTGHPEVLALVDQALLARLGRGAEEDQGKRDALRGIFSTIWKLENVQQKTVIDSVVARLQKNEKSRLLTPTEQLILRLNLDFPGGDVGVLGPLFLNYFTLQPGEAVFLSAQEPHAYLLGDCVEVMACSDNTIRAGLTPKFKDIPTLCQSLTYGMGRPPLVLPVAVEADKGTFAYRPIFKDPEFAIHKITAKSSVLLALDAASVLIVVSGSCTLSGSPVPTGSVLFIPKAVTIAFTNKSTDLLAFRAFTPFE